MKEPDPALVAPPKPLPDGSDSEPEDDDKSSDGVQAVPAPAAHLLRIGPGIPKKTMKPATKMMTTMTSCIMCKKSGTIRCTHKSCMAHVCSAYCAGYSNPEDFDPSNYTCPQHSEEEDRAWFCGLCDEMIDDRIQPLIPSIGCDKCDTWYCKTCVGFKRKSRPPKVWYCGDCIV